MAQTKTSGPYSYVEGLYLVINSYNYKAAMSYVQGRNASDVKDFYVEPDCFARNFYYMALMEEVNLKDFYDHHVLNCEYFLDIVTAG